MNGQGLSPIQYYFSILNYIVMKKLIVCFALFAIAKISSAQEKAEIEKVCMNYIEGFYEGDTTKLIASVSPSLYKFGYWKNNTTGNYDLSRMTYRQALDYAKGIQARKDFAKADAPKKVEVYDVMNTIAAVKIHAWWGVDYMLLSKQNGKWMIYQVLWEGPPAK